MSEARAVLTKGKAIAIIMIIVVAAIVGGLYFSSGPPQLSVSVGTTTSVGTAGAPIGLVAILSVPSASVNNVTWNFGDGSIQTGSDLNTTHVYQNGGHYLVLVQVTATIQSFLRSFTTTVSNGMALFSLPVQPNLTPERAQISSVPTINFRITENPTAPVFSVGDVVHPVGGFLQSPANSNWTIQEYAWDFGNGNGQVVSANSSSLPSQDVTVTYADPGLYPLSLTLTTNSPGGGTAAVSAVQTVAVQSSALPFALLTNGMAVTNPGIITEVSVGTGGPLTFDPQIVADQAGVEIAMNVYETLILYNGSNTHSFIPYLAATLPTRQNGGISPDFRTYTFQIRKDQRFSNGDPITAYDVWFSYARALAFTAGAPPTMGYAMWQLMIPGVQNGTASVYANNTWPVATTALTYDNDSNTVTFHLNGPATPEYFFDTETTIGAAGVTEAKYACSAGACFNEANWNSYKNQANLGSYNTQMQWNPVTSGPYMIQSYTPGQSIELAPNPYYPGLPGIPKPTKTIIIDWVKTPDIALLMFQDGQADAIGGSSLPPSDLPTMQKLQSQGLVNIYNWPTLSVYFFTFTININKALEATQLGTFNEPSNYFADLPTRLAFIDSWDYQGYLNNILGNAKYGVTFGVGYQGTIPPGVTGYAPPDQLGGLPTQDLEAARGNFSISAWHDMKITVPLVVYAGDSVMLAGAEEWASALYEISGGNITATAVPLLHSILYADLAPGQNPLGVYRENWAPPDYPYPSDWLTNEYLQGGTYPGANGWTVSNFASLPPPNPNGLVHLDGSTYTQAQVYNWLNGNVTLASFSVDPVEVQNASVTAQRLAIAMGLYGNVVLTYQFWYFRSWIGGYQNVENPMYNGSGLLTFFWLTKESSTS